MGTSLLLASSFVSLVSPFCDPTETMRQELMGHVYCSLSFGVVKDFDCKPEFSAPERLALASCLTSSAIESRKAALRFFYAYFLLKRQYEPAKDYKAFAENANKSLGRYQKIVIAGLEHNLSDSDPCVRSMAASTLLALQPEHTKASEAFDGFVKDKERAGPPLGFGSPKLIVPILNRSLDDKEASVRTAALQSVVLLGKQAKDTAPKIAAMLVSEDPAIMGDLPIIGVPRLPVSEDLAYQCLTQMGSEARDALPVLLKRANKEPRNAPPRVLHVLGMVGTDSKEAIKVLDEAMGSHSLDVQMHAASGMLLARPGDEKALKYLKDSLNSEQKAVRKNAIMALARVGPSAEALVEEIVKILQDTTDEDQLIEIAQALGSIGPGAKRAVPELESLLQFERLNARNPNPDRQEFTFHLAEALAFALAKQGNEGEVALVRVLQDNGAKYRYYAAAALAMFGERASDQTVKALVKELDSQNLLTQHYVIVALGGFGPRAKSAAPELRRIIETPFPDDRNDSMELEYYLKVLAGWALKRISE